jgi:hypothetical protein
METGFGLWCFHHQRLPQKCGVILAIGNAPRPGLTDEYSLLNGIMAAAISPSRGDNRPSSKPDKGLGGADLLKKWAKS